jgi:hypothetical protein
LLYGHNPSRGREMLRGPKGAKRSADRGRCTEARQAPSIQETNFKLRTPPLLTHKTAVRVTRSGLFLFNFCWLDKEENLLPRLFVLDAKTLLSSAGLLCRRSTPRPAKLQGRVRGGCPQARLYAQGIGARLAPCVAKKQQANGDLQWEREFDA